jgi:hypothetical protein
LFIFRRNPSSLCSNFTSRLFQGLIFALSLLCTVALVVRLFKKLLAVVLGTEGTAIFILQETFFGRKEAVC